MEDFGDVKLCLGIRVQRDESKSLYTLVQSHYIKELVDRFNLENAKFARTPLEVNLDLRKNDSKELPGVPYQRLIRSLMYVAVCTRPDVAYAVNYLSQFNTCYSVAHWNCAKRVLRYLKNKCDEKLTFRKTNKDLIGLIDANWAGDSNDRRSCNGFVFILAGGAISWESLK
jgi:hypothetical protein